MTILRIYKPDECDTDGNPLDWLRCGACGGTGRVEGVPVVVDGHDPSDPNAEWTETDVPCSVCDSHGSLHAAALAYFTERVADEG